MLFGFITGVSANRISILSNIRAMQRKREGDQNLAIRNATQSRRVLNSRSVFESILLRLWQTQPNDSWAFERLPHSNPSAVKQVTTLIQMRVPSVVQYPFFNIVI